MPEITYDVVIEALKSYYEVPDYSNVREIFCQQSFDEQIEDIVKAFNGLEEQC